jgi:hypothetical protein
MLLIVTMKKEACCSKRASIKGQYSAYRIILVSSTQIILFLNLPKFSGKKKKYFMLKILKFQSNYNKVAKLEITSCPT